MLDIESVGGGAYLNHIVAFNEWRNRDKTFIILNGGTSNERISSPHYGSLNQHRDWLNEFGVRYATFNEPDLNDALSAVVFLVDEKIFDAKKYPAFYKWLEDSIGKDEIYKKTFGNSKPLSEHFPLYYDIWQSDIGERVIEFRTWLKQFRFA